MILEDDSSWNEQETMEDDIAMDIPAVQTGNKCILNSIIYLKK